VCKIPLRRCINAEGKKGWSWGNGGCQVAENDLESKKQAIRVGLKVSGPEGFKKHERAKGDNLMKDKTQFDGYNILDAIADYLAKADPANNASLDKPRELVGMNIVISPYDKSASPETDPKDEDKDGKVGYDQPTLDETRPKQVTAEGLSEDVNEANPSSMSYKAIAPKADRTSDDGPDPDGRPAGDDGQDVDESTYGAIAASYADYRSQAYVSQKQRDEMPSEDFGDPENEGFPVKDLKHWHAAWRLVGRKPPEDQARIKKNLARIGKRKGFPIPKDYKD
jgi:hypothetical protein